MVKRFCLLSALLICSVIVSAQVSLQSFVTGLTSPVDIKHCGDDRIFILEQPGRIRIADSTGALNPRPFLDITGRVKYGGEQGCLGFAFPPDFASSRCFYVNYTSRPNGATTISRFHVDSLNPDSAIAGSEEILLTIYQPYTNHNGGHIAFRNDGYLYIGMGDGGSAGDPGNRSQNKDSLLGKILRIAVDPSNPTYSIPPTNPFANGGGRPEIYATGIRNPWRWSFDKLTQDFWIGDVGQNVIEEIDYEQYGSTPGSNYGWRCYEGNSVYNTSGCQPQSSYDAPVYTYNHSGGNCSVTGGYVYRGGKINSLYGKYVFTDYCVSQIRVLDKENNFSVTNLGALGGATAIVGFGEDKYGNLYCGSGTSGKVFKFVSSDCTPVAQINSGLDTIVSCGNTSIQLAVPSVNDFSYSWQKDGSLLANDTLSNLTATADGQYVVTVSNNGCTNSDTVYVQFSSVVNSSFTGLDTLYCIYGDTVILVPDVTGGVFSGSGVSNDVFIPAATGLPGIYPITYSITDLNGCVFSTTQNVRVDLCLNIDQNYWSKTLTVAPNPNNGAFTINGYTENDRAVSVEILNSLGAKVYDENVVVGSGNMSIPFNLYLPAGIYFAKLSSGKEVISLKVNIR